MGKLNGVIFAHNQRDGESLRRFMSGRHNWIIVTPQSISKWTPISPEVPAVLLVVDNPAHPDMVLKHHTELVALFGGRAPEVWHTREAGT